MQFSPTDKNWTYHELLAAGTQIISTINADNPRQEAMWLLEEQVAFGAAISPKIAEHYLRLAQQRAAGEPLQYLLGEWEFFGNSFYVGRGVLIPRPETELLVEEVLRFIKTERSRSAIRFSGENLSLLDLYSGSGCIAISCVKALDSLTAVCVEKYDAALHYLQKNINRHALGNRIMALQADACDIEAVQQANNLHSDKPCDKARTYDIITANPPYLTAEEMGENRLQPELLAEPQTALLGGDDGYFFYRQLPQWLSLLNKGGMLITEIGDGQGEYVRELFIKYAENIHCNIEIRIIYDYANIDRFVKVVII